VVQIASRASWGARYADGDKTLSGLAVGVFIHHTVTKQLSPSASVAEEREQMRSIESIGQSRFGTGISYNVIVFPSGRAYQGASFNRRGTHTGGRNSTVRSISFAGNYETNKPTDAAIATAAAIYEEGKGKWWGHGAPLYGHRDLSQTACPGKHLYARLGDIRSGGTTPVDNPVRPLPPVKPVGGDKTKVDGFWGKDTTFLLQKVLGTPRDGIVSSQPVVWRSSNPGLTSGWDWDADPNGSRVISALQEVLGVKRDGMFGPDSIRAFQRRMGTTVDGELWRESPAIEELQRRLNKGKI
jgi:hypothetical protein